MSCPIREETDLARYLLDPTSAEFEAFRAHFPGCRECADEVALYTAIESTLSDPSGEGGAEPGPWHPDVERLARFAGGAGAAGPEQQQMQRHLETCARCRTEWQALQSFDFAEVADAPGSRGAGETAPARGWRDRLAAWLGIDPSPRLAAVAAVVVGGAVLGTWLAVAPDPARMPAAEPRLAAATAPPEPAESELRVAATRADAPAPPSLPLAERGPAPAGAQAGAPSPLVAERARTAAPVDTGTDRVTPEPAAGGEVRLADADLAAPSAAAVAAVDGAAGDEAEAAVEPPVRSPSSAEAGDEILLASLSQMAPPAYAAPAGSSELAWMHQFGSVRGTRGMADPPLVTAHAPDHVGLTRQASPRLWWSISEDADQDVVVTVVDDREIDPVLEIVLPGPQAAGMASISLADHGVELDPGVDYRWFVALVYDADRPSRNVVSGGAIRRVPLDASQRAELEAAAPAERGHLLAREGYWYDAYDFFAGLAARHPQVAALGDHRQQLLSAARTGP